MKIYVELPDYDGNGLDVIWENNAKYSINVNGNNVVVSANKSGLIAFAKQMLYMAYHDLPKGSHVHYDDFFTKIETNDFELIIEKQTD